MNSSPGWTNFSECDSASNKSACRGARHGREKTEQQREGGGGRLNLHGAGDVRPNFLAVSLAVIASGHEEPVPLFNSSPEVFVWSR
jgi:hypothetical protein